MIRTTKETGMMALIQDVSGHDAARLRLEENARVAQTVKNVPIVLAYTDTDLRYTWIYNPHADFSADAMIGKRDDELQANQAGVELTEAKRKVLSEGRILRRSITFDMSDGPHTYDVVLDALRNEDGEKIGVITVAVDVSDFAHEERKHLETQALLNSLFDSAPIGLGVWDRELRFLRLNETLAAMNGISPEAHIGSRASELLPEIKNVLEIESLFQKVIDEGRPIMNVHVIGTTPADPDKEHVWKEHFYPIRLQEEVIGVGAVIEDVTELRQAQEDVRMAHDRLECEVAERTAQLVQVNQRLQNALADQQRTAQELAEVRRRLAQSREAERLRLAHELHDTTMQELNALTFDLAQLNSIFEDDRFTTASAAIRDKIGQINHTLRRVVGDLRPPILVDFGLKAAVSAYIELLHTNYPALEVHFEAAELPTLTETTAITLYRIQQQATRNVIQHAEASQVWIRLQMQENNLLLEVEDNGRGFAKPQRWIELVRQGHLGVVSMSERAAEIDGVLEIDTEPGRGTIVRLRVPIDPWEEGTAA